MAKKRSYGPFSQPGTNEPNNPLDITAPVESAILNKVKFGKDLIEDEYAPISEMPDLGQMGKSSKQGSPDARRRLAVWRATGVWPRAS